MYRKLQKLFSVVLLSSCSFFFTKIIVKTLGQAWFTFVFCCFVQVLLLFLCVSQCSYLNTLNSECLLILEIFLLFFKNFHSKKLKENTHKSREHSITTPLISSPIFNIYQQFKSLDPNCKISSDFTSAITLKQ